MARCLYRWHIYSSSTPLPGEILVIVVFSLNSKHPSTIQNLLNGSTRSGQKRYLLWKIRIPEIPTLEVEADLHVYKHSYMWLNIWYTEDSKTFRKTFEFLFSVFHSNYSNKNYYNRKKKVAWQIVLQSAFFFCNYVLSRALIKLLTCTQSRWDYASSLIALEQSLGKSQIPAFMGWDTSGNKISTKSFSMPLLRASYEFWPQWRLSDSQRNIAGWLKYNRTPSVQKFQLNACKIILLISKPSVKFILKKEKAIERVNSLEICASHVCNTWILHS